MKKLLFLFALSCASTAPLRAQTVVPIVNGTVTIPAGTIVTGRPASFKVILSTNVTSLTISGGTGGQIIWITYIQLGGNTVTYGSGISGNACVVATSSGSQACEYIYDIGNNTWNGAGGGVNGAIPSYTVATLPASAPLNTVVHVTDSTTGCSVGGGSSHIFCIWNGSSWVQTTSNATPGGASIQGQFNNSGAMGGSPCSNLGSGGLSTGPLNLDCDTHPKGPNPSNDIMRFGAAPASPGSIPNIPGITANCTSGNPSLPVSSANAALATGTYVVVWGCGGLTVNTPGAITVSPIANASQTMGLLDVALTGGGTQYCYQALARTFLGGTSVGSEVCTTTGPATLGLNTNAITSVSFSNNIATYNTTLAHTLVAGEVVRIVGTKTNELGGSIFDCWCTIASVPNNTSFTVNLTFDTRAGAIVAATANTGTVNYWHGVKITVPATTNTFENYIYGRATGTGKPLIGIMQPQPQGGTCAALFVFGDSTCLTFDDFGSGVLNATPLAPAYIPTTVPAAGSTHDMLLAQITGGGGTTTLTVNPAPSNTINTQTILHDDAQALVAAWNYSASAGGSGSLMIPSTGNVATNYVFNAPIAIVNQGGQRPVIQQGGQITVNEPMAFSTFTKWMGVPSGTQVAPGFSQQIVPAIVAHGASPVFYVYNANSFYLSGVQMQQGGPSSATMFIQDGGGIPTSKFTDVVWAYQGGGQSHSNTFLVMRGNGADVQIVNNSLLATQNGALTGYADNTPGMIFNQVGNVRFDWFFMSGEGTLSIPNGQGAGAYIKATDIYCQGCYMPYFSFTNSSGPIYGRISNVIQDTSFDSPLVANFNGAPMFLSFDSGAAGTTGSGGIASGASIGTQVTHQDISGYPSSGYGSGGLTGAFGHGSRYPVADGVFGRISIGVDGEGRSFQIGQGFSLFTGTGSYPVPTCVVSSGGSLTTGTYYAYYAPIGAITGSEWNTSLYCTFTVTTGNQTVTLTAPNAVAGATSYNWYVSSTIPTGGAWCGTGAGRNTISVVFVNNGVCTGNGPSTTNAAGGPIELKNSTLATQNLGLGLTQLNSVATALRTVTIPDNTGIVPVTGYQNTAFDTFNRASLNTSGPCASGSCWTTANPPNISVTISGNQLLNGCTLNTWCANYWNANAFTADQSSSGVLTTFGVGGGGLIPMVRYNASLNQGYVCGGNINKVNFASNTNTPVATGLTINNGDTIWCDAQGTTITAYDLTTGQSISGTDSTIATGFPGVAAFSSGANTLDNWMAGNFDPIAQADRELTWRQPQHVPALTVGSPVPTAGALPFGALYAGTYNTQSNCSSSGGTCGSAAAGSVSIAAAATTVTVSTTAVTANSQILIQEDATLGTKLSVTCNTTTGRTYTVTTRTAGTSFVITASAAPTTNPACLSYSVIN